MEEVIKLNAVDQYNKMFGLETLHPLVSVVDLSEATGYPRHFTLNYGVYALFLKNTKCGDIRYGKQYYDYQEGTVTSFAPGQVTEVNMPAVPPRLDKRHLAGTGNKAVFLLFLFLYRGTAFVRRRERNLPRLSEED